MAAPVAALPGTVRLRGLDPEATYQVAPLPPADAPAGLGRGRPNWFTPTAPG
ncbi:hypothetical protein NKH77_05450 [Streptomyces sp. M19]